MVKRQVKLTEVAIPVTRGGRSKQINTTTAVTPGDSGAVCEGMAGAEANYIEPPQQAPITMAEHIASQLQELIDGQEDGKLVDDDAQDELTSQVKFADEIKIDFIPAIDYRILCRFLGVTSVNDVKNHPFSEPPLITFLLMENLQGYMSSKGYEYAGELNFSQEGYSIPPEKNPWFVKGKETTFTIKGFQYFEKIGGDRKDNVAFFLFSDLERGGSVIMCFSTDVQRCKEIINELKEYTKQHNCLRGAKLKDINMVTASFSEVDTGDKYTWDNYYFNEDIKALFELEIFGFLREVKRYNDHGIFRRGFILHGAPGCVLPDTKIRVRKKKEEGRHDLVEE